MSDIEANSPAVDDPAVIVAMILAGLEAAKKKTDVEDKADNEETDDDDSDDESDDDDSDDDDDDDEDDDDEDDDDEDDEEEEPRHQREFENGSATLAGTELLHQFSPPHGAPHSGA